MNMQNILMMTATVLVLGTAFAIIGSQPAIAQYGVGEQPGAVTLEESLALAEGKVTNAEQAGAYGSGTAMVGVGLNDTAIFVGILVAIFGGVAAAFFIAGRSRKREPARY
ncbi:MAG: hypothetical protein ACPKPY_14510 [Nitrososphaeraceae archaeon]